MTRQVHWPLLDLLLWWCRPVVLGASAVALATFASALAVVHSAHLHRQLFIEVNRLETGRDYLDSEYERLLLERSTWSDYGRVREVAEQRLDMHVPEPRTFLIVGEEARDG